MRRHRNAFWSSLVALAIFAMPAAAEDGLVLKKGDRVCLIGNTLAERMQHHGRLEARVQARFPRHELVFRNLGYSGDELTLRLRSAGFGTPDEHLTKNKADVIFAFFGYNESFAGPEGLPKFKKDLEEFITHTLSQKYNGKSAPRLVLFSPIAHENLRDPNLPDGSANNRNIKLYAEAMAEAAKAHRIPFVDLYHPSLSFYVKSTKPLTIDGVHLNDSGDERIASAIEAALFGATPAADPALLEKIRAAVLDKNFYFFNRYRTVDGYSIYGGRADLAFVDGQTNRVVMDREMEILDVMTANRDKRIWAAARGEDLKPDDSNTPPFLKVKTNRPGTGPNGEHVFLGGEEAISKMTLGKNLKINLFASEERFPDIAKAVQMTFDPKGRLWAIVMHSYPHWKPKEELNDKVLILEDVDRDGRADKCTVFADHLQIPTGIELWNDGVFVGQGPDLVFMKDTDGDDKADVFERVVNGLDTADTHHTQNSFVLDPGGALYLQEGTFHHTQVETPWGPPVRNANAGVYRFEPRTKKFGVYVAYNFANPHGHVFDAWGQDFVTDGTGNVNYFGTAFSGHIDFPKKHPAMEPWFKQWTRPCGGTEILSSSHFPDSMQGDFLDANVIGFQGILHYRFVEKDSGFVGVEAEPIVHSADPNFRPVDIEVGPDGAIYFIDWQNPIIGHMQHNLRDPSRDRVHGRIYRVTYEGRPLSPRAEIAGEPVDKLLDLLKSPENRVRYRARIELSGRKTPEVVAALSRWVDRLDRDSKNHEHDLLEALWAHQAQNVVNEPLLKRLLRSPEPRARAAATRVLCYQRDRVADALGLLKIQANDEHPRVRLEAVRAASFFRDSKAADVALEALKHPTDYYIDYCLKETIRQLEPWWSKSIRAGGSVAEGNPAGVNYLLESVPTADLAKLPRTEMVDQVMLWRPQVLPEDRKNALEDLARIRRTAVIDELLAAVERRDRSTDEHAEHVIADLARLLHSRPAEELRRNRAGIAKLAEAARKGLTRRIAYVALMTGDGSLDPTWKDAEKSAKTLRDVLEAVPLIAGSKLRASAYDRVKPLVFGPPKPLADQAKAAKGQTARFVRIELPRRGTLTLAEVQVFVGGRNVAPEGTAKQSSVSHGGEAKRAVDGNLDGSFAAGGQTHTRENDRRPWWELDLGRELPIESIAIWNRTESNGQFAKRLEGYRLILLNDAHQVVYRKDDNAAPSVSARFDFEADPTSTIRSAAMSALVATGRDEASTFRTLADFIRRGDLRQSAVRAISRIPVAQRPRDQAKPLIDAVLAHAGRLSADERKSPEIRDELQLANDLAALLPADQAKAARRAIRELGVPVVVVRPIPDQMLYDRTDIYVEAGRPVEIVFENIDIMPHNLIVIRPGMIERVGMAAEKMAADPNAFAKNFVPDVKDVLHATRLLQPGQSDRLYFNAPSEPADYPFVCTFPGHWQRMRGVLHVVTNLDDVAPELLAGGPVSPNGPTRSMVKAWTVQDLAGALDHLEHGKRDLERGRQLLTTLSCVQCHSVNGVGGKVGPDFAEVRAKIADGKMSRLDLLASIVEPSKEIDEKYRSHAFALANGQVIVGIVESQTGDEIRVRANPLEIKDKTKPDVVVLKKSDIDEQVSSKISLMPQGLLNTAEEEEVLDLLSYLLSLEPKKP